MRLWGWVEAEDVGGVEVFEAKRSEMMGSMSRRNDGCWVGESRLYSSRDGELHRRCEF